MTLNHVNLRSGWLKWPHTLAVLGWERSGHWTPLPSGCRLPLSPKYCEEDSLRLQLSCQNISCCLSSPRLGNLWISYRLGKPRTNQKKQHPPPLQNTHRHEKRNFRIIFGALAEKTGKSFWGCYRDKFLPNSFGGLVRALPLLPKKGALTGKGLLPKQKSNKAKTFRRHFCLKPCKARCTPEKRDWIKNPRHGQHPERDRNEIGTRYEFA